MSVSEGRDVTHAHGSAAAGELPIGVRGDLGTVKREPFHSVALSTP